MVESSSKRILLTGATGYVGGRLLNKLQEDGALVRCLARSPRHLQHKVADQTEVVQGDVLDADSLRRAMVGCSQAFYLIHSMGDARGFAERDRLAAHNFAEAAHSIGLERIVYLGALGNDKIEVSEHLTSRHEVGRILRSYRTPVVELRASIVIGSGSLSFEMIRALVEKLPVMITPRWVSVQAQPIAIEDVVDYLAESLTIPLDGSRIFDIGGEEPISYGNLMREYARQRGLRRFMIPVPLLTPYLSSLWLGLVTPLYARIGRKLIDGLRAPTVVCDNSASEVFTVKPMGVKQAIEHAIRNEDREFALTSWTDSLSSSGAARYGGQPVGARLVDSREIEVDSSPVDAFEPIARIGGENGWYALNFLWHLRAWLDLLLGGVGMRRSSPMCRPLHTGDPLDFWRVETVDPPRLLYLRAEMRLPGRAWLRFEVEPSENGSLIRQTAIFEPKGLMGRLYWYGIWPVHVLVFRRMLAGIAKQAVRRPGIPEQPHPVGGT